jgi:hypothetical protein
MDVVFNIPPLQLTVPELPAMWGMLLKGVIYGILRKKTSHI